MWRWYNEVVRAPSPAFADDHPVVRHRGEPVAYGTGRKPRQFMKPFVSGEGAQRVRWFQVVHSKCQENVSIPLSTGCGDQVRNSSSVGHGTGRSWTIGTSLDTPGSKSLVKPY